ncbi:MAG TPA: hypothetical protein VI796_04490 [Candidatus Thermoplasmatota archaeon]|nr:hypothetical protein [Candidatus Thermoplasmatota archaeon]
MRNLAPALAVAVLVLLAGCSGGGGSSDPTPSPSATTTSTGPEPEPVFIDQVYQEEDAGVLVGNPATCEAGVPPASAATWSESMQGNGFDSWGFVVKENSTGLAYNFTGAVTGQELGDYVLAFLNEDFSTVLGGAAAAPGDTVGGTVPEESYWGFVTLCAGGHGAAHYESYVRVEAA